jgi:FtsZ-binding cell division protein ZapB
MQAFVVLMAILCVVTGVSAQSQTEEQAAAYAKAITQRAAKIVTPLQISDSAKANQVQAIIVQQYRNLSAIHDASEAKIKALKEKAGEGMKPDDQSVKEIETSTEERLKQAHNTYITKLSALLTQQQVDQVKDGMTYGVLQVTWKGYQDMIPTLTDNQKNKIYAWLLEAREQAMDQGSSEAKHKVFGKYKGRINNYLSTEGYDLKKEEKAWQERLRKKREQDNSK